MPLVSLKSKIMKVKTNIFFTYQMAPVLKTHL